MKEGENRSLYLLEWRKRILKKKLKSDETYINCIVNIKAFYDILLSAANSYFDNLMLHYHKLKKARLKTINADEMLHSPFFNNIRRRVEMNFKKVCGTNS